MTFGVRMIVVVLAAFGVASTAASIGVSWWMHGSGRRTMPGAATLFQMRLVPAMLSLVAAWLAMASFEQFEPRGEERTGLLLVLFAALASATLATMAFRLARLSRASGRAMAYWMRSAERIVLPGITVPAYRIDSAFPVVAMAGVFQPRLIIARSVLDACPAHELQAILAHEQWHVRNGDNLRRILMAAVPDAMMWTPLWRRFSAAWQLAAEDAADAEAALTTPLGRVSLAEALIRVGRLVPAGMTPANLPASALFRGENLEHRIRRLLDPPADFARHRDRSTWLIMTAASLLVVSLFALHPIHELVEAAVAFLP